MLTQASILESPDGLIFVQAGWVLEPLGAGNLGWTYTDPAKPEVFCIATGRVTDQVPPTEVEDRNGYRVDCYRTEDGDFAKVARGEIYVYPKHPLNAEEAIAEAVKMVRTYQA